MSYIVYDLVLLAILVLFALRGMHRGLILSLCSLLAVLVAVVGALLISNAWAPSVVGWVQPTLQPTVTAAVQAALPEDAANEELPQEDLLALLDEADLPMGLNEFLADLREEEVTVLTPDSLINNLAFSLAEKLANAIAHIGLFLLSFLLILILWHLLSRTLDLVAHLPGLHLLNKLGGFVFGAFRGAVLLFICAWLVRWLWNDLIPAEAIEQSRLLHVFMTVNPLDYLAKI